MPEELTFEKLWSLGTATKSSWNCIQYHPCCDSWTTRQAKASKGSHSESKKWKVVVKEAKQPGLERKESLLAMMRARGWRIPAMLNQTCTRPAAAAIQQAENQVEEQEDMEMPV